jgi:hypothetical protein
MVVRICKNNILLFSLLSLLLLGRFGYYCDAATSAMDTKTKKLVVVSGPHHVGASRIYKFLDKYATNYHDDDDDDDDKSNEGKLGRWRWPTIQSKEDLDLLLSRGGEEGEGEMRSDYGSTDSSTMNRHDVFDLLFTKQTHEHIQDTLLTAIRTSWEDDQSEMTNHGAGGVVIGTNYFDHILPRGGDTNTAAAAAAAAAGKYDAVKILFRLKEELDIVNNRDIVIVMLYRSPRLDQWTSIVREKLSSSSSSNSPEEGGQQQPMSYPDLICNTADNKRNEEIYDPEFLSEMLNTSMNPLNLAKVFRQHRFTVILVDEMGVNLAEKDIAHTFACSVLHHGIDCEDEWVTGIGVEDQSGGYNDKNHNMMWSDKDEDELERIFQKRDCAYKSDLTMMDQSSPSYGKYDGTDTNDDGGLFHVIRQSSLWKDCNDRDTTDYSIPSSSQTRDKLMDTDFFLDVLQSQQGCGSQSKEVLDILLPSSSMSTATAATGNKEVTLWLLIPLTMIMLVVTLGLFLIRSRRRQKSQSSSTACQGGGGMDGLFRKDSSSTSSSTGLGLGGKVIHWPFWSQHDQHPFPSEGASTESSSSDDEYPPKPQSIATAPSGFVDVCIDARTNPVPPPARTTTQNGTTTQLCRACTMVGVDPKCSFCGGGQLSLRTTSTTRAKGSSSKGSASVSYSVREKNNVRHWNGMTRVVRGGSGKDTITTAPATTTGTGTGGEHPTTTTTTKENEKPCASDMLPLDNNTMATSAMMAEIDMNDLNDRWHDSSTVGSDSQYGSSSSTALGSHTRKGPPVDPTATTTTTLPCDRRGMSCRGKGGGSFQPQNGRRESKSTVLRKFQQLLDLKNTPVLDGDGSVQNLQLGRNTEIGDNTYNDDDDHKLEDGHQRVWV